MKHLAVLLLCGVCSAQNFWTRETKVETGVFVAELALDGYTTQVDLRAHRVELNPLARPLVKHGAAGQVAASAVAATAVLGSAYLLHHFHHDRLAHWVMRSSVIIEGANDVRQIQITPWK